MHERGREEEREGGREREYALKITDIDRKRGGWAQIAAHILPPALRSTAQKTTDAQLPPLSDSFFLLFSSEGRWVVVLYRCVGW